MEIKNNKYKWNVGGLFTLDNLFFEFFKECFDNKIKNPIHSVFGSVNCIFAGGRCRADSVDLDLENNLNYYDLEEIEYLLQIYNRYGVSCRYTFTSLDIKEEEFNDKYSNDLLKLLEKYSLPENPNGVIIALESVNNYIKKTYPKLITIASVTRVAIDTNFQWDDSDYYNNLAKNYDIIVVNSAIGRGDNLNVLKGIQDKSKIEIIVNNVCGKNCPAAKKHYELSSKILRAFLLKEPVDELLAQREKFLKYHCPRQKTGSLLLSYFTDEQLDELYKLGINNFKLQGREYTPNMMLDILRYFIVPDFLTN